MVFSTMCKKPADEMPDLSGIEIVMTPVAGNIYVLAAVVRPS